MTAIIIFCILLALCRGISRGLLFKHQLKMPFWRGMTPIYGDIVMYDKLHEPVLQKLGMILRLSSCALFAGVLFSQQQYHQVMLAHVYGLMLGFYEPPDFSVLWNIGMGVGCVCAIIGILCRLIAFKRGAVYFGIHSRVLNFLAMFAPTILYLYLATTKKYTFILNKDTSKMSREEYAMYLAMVDEEDV